ncbi:hypothetical protein QQG09_00420 [Melissococcus plutonius]|uniref:Uncharacterized protein n=2 Tax=Melissococcus plutonius TaxID=33970 RepID=A0A2Z5Y4F5_9ENTE|nr:hypothetical protein [Melissococcus plutonius]BAL62759.1 hypothetical protein MPD5_1559 [Melissococcus plutonius DAT561]MCV2498678.1 hypothetical protein [Melissococcus plutonius]MCV2500981.1 hypothetical protein [Melissococcus plutonius]MCV2504654.1 hypothetical protein [Melissococcus plutonius]MCV2507114.1 hypothetical protein [Melissococcus plutonius]
MNRVDNNRKKKKYLFIIGGLGGIILILTCFIVVNSYSSEPNNETSSASSMNSSSMTNNIPSVSQSSSEIRTSNSTRNRKDDYEDNYKNTYKNNYEDSDAAEAVKRLSTEQRAALIILGAPSDWFFNGSPSQSTIGQPIIQIAESNTNTIILTKVPTKLARNTSEEDQLFSVAGKDGEIGARDDFKNIYAVGRNNNKIYYYMMKIDGSDPGTKMATSLGEANIDEIWKSYYNTGSMSTINEIANNILIE